MKILLTAAVSLLLCSCGAEVDVSNTKYNKGQVQHLYGKLPVGVSMITLPNRRGKGTVKCFIANNTYAVDLDCGDYNE